MDAGKNGCRTGLMQDRTDAGKNGCRAGWMQDRMESTIDAGQDGCRKGWIQYRIKCVKILALNELDFYIFGTI